MFTPKIKSITWSTTVMKTISRLEIGPEMTLDFTSRSVTKTKYKFIFRNLLLKLWELLLIPQILFTSCSWSLQFTNSLQSKRLTLLKCSSNKALDLWEGTMRSQGIKTQLEKPDDSPLGLHYLNVCKTHSKPCSDVTCPWGYTVVYCIHKSTI